MRAGRFVSLSLLLLVLVWSAEGLNGMKVRRRAWRTRPCAGLPEELLEQMFGRMSVGVLSAFSHTLQLVPGTQNLSCPSTARRSPNGVSRTPVNLLSLSPWAYRINHDPARYPRSLPEAYCLCRGCLTGPNGEESEQFRSVPVYIPTAVLKRTGSCLGGRHSYIESYVSVPVGCTCVPALQDTHSLSSKQSKAKKRTN
ncbi:interleukin-17D [Colossoma macropomum]|uniref:interleukin-17D n=1 Tax=Colossoma macropomum TaxID=42526 RepID=UPI001864FBC8|nr:interleukin-17D [Colossoma macropomum]